MVKGTILPCYTKNEDQLADIFTKSASLKPLAFGVHAVRTITGRHKERGVHSAVHSRTILSRGESRRMLTWGAANRGGCGRF
ncbi:unnamed protein product [Cochlearia groenlandica]